MGRKIVNFATTTPQQHLYFPFGFSKSFKIRTNVDGDGRKTFMMKFHPLLFSFHFIFQEIQLNVISLWMGMDEWNIVPCVYKENRKWKISH